MSNKIINLGRSTKSSRIIVRDGVKPVSSGKPMMRPKGGSAVALRPAGKVAKAS